MKSISSWYYWGLMTFHGCCAPIIALLADIVFGDQGVKRSLKVDAAFLKYDSFYTDQAPIELLEIWLHELRAGSVAYCYTTTALQLQTPLAVRFTNWALFVLSSRRSSCAPTKKGIYLRTTIRLQRLVQQISPPVPHCSIEYSWHQPHLKNPIWQ